MIETELLKSWLTCGLRFANLSAAFTDSEAAHALSGTDGVPTELRAELAQWDEMRDDKPLAPERGYRELHRAWRTFLKVLDSGERKSKRAQAFLKAPRNFKWLQRWCVDRSMARLGENNFCVESGPDVAPFVFGDDGRPQFGLVGWRRPEGMLAAVGAELIAPGAAFAVRACAKPSCGHYLMIPTIDRGPGASAKYCCKECRPDNTERVRKHRAKVKARGRK